MLDRAMKSVGMLSGLLGLSAVLALGGCRSVEDPGGYSRQRPPADRLADGDRGLQSYDIITAADLMADSLLSLPELNAAPERMLVVTDRVVNNTVTYPNSLQIFIEQLQVELNRRGRDRIQLIANRDEYRNLQSRELEQGFDNEREFGGAGAPRQEPGPAGIQPDFILHAKVNDLPNRETNFYQFIFELTDLNNRTIFWTDAYTVRVAR